MRNKQLFDRFLDALGDKIDFSLRLQLQQEMMMQEYRSQQEREKLIEDTAERVLSRLSATVDVSDIIKRIDELDKALDSLFKKFN